MMLPFLIRRAGLPARETARPTKQRSQTLPRREPPSLLRRAGRSLGFVALAVSPVLWLAYEGLSGPVPNAAVYGWFAVMAFLFVIRPRSRRRRNERD